MQFFVVYIAEAHALDGFAPNVRTGAPLVEEPITNAERMLLAGKCVVGLSVQEIPAVVDRIDDKVATAYQAWPDRLYLVGKNGRLSYCGDKGPRGFDPDGLEKAIRVELGIKEGSSD